MRIVLDECIPRQLRKHLVGHEVATVASSGSGGIKNGRLLDLADARFDVLLTVDRSIPYQQRLRNRQIAVMALIAPNNKLETLQPFLHLRISSTGDDSTWRGGTHWSDAKVIWLSLNGSCRRRAR